MGSGVLKCMISRSAGISVALAAGIVLAVALGAAPAAFAEDNGRSADTFGHGGSNLAALLGLAGTLVTALLAFQAQRLVSKTQASNATALEAIKQTNASALEAIKSQLEFRVESDRLLQEKRIFHYERLLAVLQNLPKYPEPKPLSLLALRDLTDWLQGWYFGGAGLYMNTDVRNRYFDLQDGLRIVLAKYNLVSIPGGLGLQTLKVVLDRKDWEKPPGPIATLSELADPSPEQKLKARDDAAAVPIASVPTEALRELGSSLRSAMCGDLMSRRTLAQPREAR